MSLVLYSPYEEPSLTLLKEQINNLRVQLLQLKRETEILNSDYQRECSTSLADALKGLLYLSESVYKADKQVVFWYEKGKVLRIVLKPLGVNKKTSAIIQRKTTKLKTQATYVEAQFASTSQVCQEALKDVQTLNRRVNDYSKTGIGSAQENASTTMKSFEEEKKLVDVKLKEKEVECARVNANILDTDEGVARTRAATDKAEQASDKASTTAMLGFGSAIAFGALAIFCAPVAITAGIVAGSATVVGTGSAICASSLSGQAQNHRNLNRDLTAQLSTLYYEIELLKAQLAVWKSQTTHYTDATNSVNNLEDECTTMRQGANDLSSRLLKDRTILTRARAKVEHIASDLRSIEYTRTRREISGSLLEILHDLRQINEDGATNGKSLRQTLKVVKKIESQTPKILMILERAV